MFGQQVNFTFQGKEQFQTSCGGCCTIIVSILLLIFYLIKIFEFAAAVNPKLSLIENVIEGNEAFDLYDLDFRFALTKIDPRVGEITVQKVSRISNSNNTEI